MSGQKAQYVPHPEPRPPEYDYDADQTPSHHLLQGREGLLQSTESLPPNYLTSSPTTFPIGAHDRAMLVKVHEVEVHLRLLAAFWQLRQDVINQDWNDIGLDARWMIYVTRAVFRFEQWYLKVVCNDGRTAGPLRNYELPPLDVAMIWAAYLLVLPRHMALYTWKTLRQGRFIEHMVNHAWTDPTRFAADKTALIKSVSRYHAWLDLLSSSPSTFFVPTLHIDLAWHTKYARC